MRSKRSVLLGIASAAVALFLFGMVAAFLSRHETICPDGKVPLAKRSALLGQTEYRCQNGQTVTK